MISTLGALLLLEHKARHGQWWDNKVVCHGKLGGSLLLAGLVGREIEKHVYTKRDNWRELNLFEDHYPPAERTKFRHRIPRK